MNNNIEIESLLKKYPKKRPALPQKQQDIYEKEYLANREGTNFITFLSQKLESWMHKIVAKKIIGTNLLEIGAGSLNHVKYVDLKNIKSYDVVEPFSFLYQESSYKKNIRKIFQDISECKSSYDSIFSIAALEHITNLPQVIAKAGLLLKENGKFINAIPCEGGFLWGLSWRLSTGLAYNIRTGCSYKALMQHEHVNDFDEIKNIISHLFESVEIRFFPLYGKHFSLYACITASNPRIDLCKKIVSR